MTLKVESLSFATRNDVSLVDSVIIHDVFDLYNWNLSSNRLVIHKGNAMDSIIAVYSWPDAKELYSEFKIGQGPDEFIVINPGDAFRENQVLSYDMMKREVFVFETGENRFSKVGIFKLFTDEDGLAYPYTYITQLSDSLFLLKMDLPQESSWQIADLKNNLMLSEFPNLVRDPEYSYTPYDFMQLVSDSMLAVVYHYMNLVQFYDLSSLEHPVLVASLGNLTSQAQLKSYNDLHESYLSAFIESGFLFCLKSSNEESSGNIVEVYGLKNATPYCIIELDRPVQAIRCDKEGYMVGYVPTDEESVFYRWNLRNWLKSNAHEFN